MGASPYVPLSVLGEWASSRAVSFASKPSTGIRATRVEALGGELVVESREGTGTSVVNNRRPGRNAHWLAEGEKELLDQDVTRGPGRPCDRREFVSHFLHE